MAETQLSQNEINALIAGAKGGDRAADARPARPQKAVKTYDFNRPDKFSKDQLRTLQSIHQTIARLSGARLSERLRTNVTMTLALTQQMIFREFAAGLTLPTMLFQANAPQLSGPFLVDVDLALALGWVDRILGGAGELPKEGREPSDIEKGLIVKLVDELIPAIAEGWSQVETVTPLFDIPRPNLAGVRIAMPTDVVAVMSFEVRYPGASAPITICLPYDTLESLMPRLSATTWYAQQKSTADTAAKAEITSTLQNVEVPVKAILGGVELTVDELASLKPGDVIRFGETTDHPVRLSVMDQAMAWAAPGKVGDRVALRLLTPLQQLMEA
jgi:flagellar motor switch protein FliM